MGKVQELHSIRPIGNPTHTHNFEQFNGEIDQGRITILALGEEKRRSVIIDQKKNRLCKNEKNGIEMHIRFITSIKLLKKKLQHVPPYYYAINFKLTEYHICGQNGWKKSGRTEITERKMMHTRLEKMFKRLKL